MAAQKGHAAVVELPLGASPLFVEAQEGHALVVGTLLAHRADRSTIITTNHQPAPVGTTTIAVAELKDHSAVAVLLR